MYEGDQGERLYLNVTGIEPRGDHRRIQHEALVIQVALQHERYGGQWEISRFEEAVDLAEGLVVHRVAFCARPLLERPGCYDTRASVGFSSTGLPGGLLLGPVWGNTIPEDGVVNVSTGTDRQPAPLTIDVSPLAGKPGCRLLDIPDDAVPATDVPLEATDAVTCGEDPFPVSFQEVNGTRYERVAASPGDEIVERPEASAWSQEGAAVELREWSAPLAAHDPSDPTELTVKEAHQVARNRSPGYRAFFDEDPNAVLLATQFETSGAASTQAPEYEYDAWFLRGLLALEPGGSGYFVQVEERRTVGSVSTYEINEEERTRLSDGTSLGAVPDRLLSIGPAINLGKDLVGTPFDGFYASQLDVPLHPYLDQNWTPFPQGFVLFAMYEEPGGDPDGGLSITSPQYLVMNGATGNLMLFETDRSNLPFS